jgi:riboflavin kinase/FMN adenylyltransferase
MFNWNGRLYGRRISLRFFRKLRDERRFNSPADLVRQVEKDIQAARRYFEKRVCLEPGRPPGAED